MTRAACGVALALLSLGAAPAPLVEVRNAGDPARRVEARAELDTGDIRLSGEVRLTLTVEGPAPLGVTPPKPFLTSSNVWRVREDGLPVREVLPNGREKWAQVYRLSPLVPGEPKIALGALTIRPGGEQDLAIEWKAEPVVRVTTNIENPTPDALRPPTDIEHLPPTPPVEHGSSPWLFAIVPILLVVAAAALVLAKRKRPPAAPRDADWAERELAAAGLTADRCAVVLRQYLAYRFGVPAETRTTPELATALRANDRLPDATVAEWQAFLDECDAARFSGTAASVAGLADRARALVARAEEQVRMSQERAQKDAKS
ncbi:MAG TPA: hypothetical protein VKD90_00590 [Gemmataceae bacterium]|nr:hypothetical protein [Gemmataceae bacterium]